MNRLLATRIPFHFSRTILRKCSPRVGYSKPIVPISHSFASSSRYLASKDPRNPTPPNPNEIFLSGTAANYIEETYAAWQKDASSVHKSWDIYFRQINAGKGPADAFMPPPTSDQNMPQQKTFAPAPAAQALPKDILDHMKVQLLVRAYQVRGHLMANLDPLGLMSRTAPPELNLSHYGLTESDLDRSFQLGEGMLPNIKSPQVNSLTLREILDKMKQVYCGTVGVDYMHISSREKCDWIRKRIEILQRKQFTKAEKHTILDRMIWADNLEAFIKKKHPTEKRFGLEGCESMIPGMKALIDTSVEYGIETIVIGMPHRGRLNVLSNVVRKPNESIFCEFRGTKDPGFMGSGDVKYHLGMNYDRATPSGKSVHVSLSANPSHLEAVDPVVLGQVKSYQFFKDDEKDCNKVMAVLLHGDAAFSAQGVVYETLITKDLPYYSTGGVIHIICNNQIGFTTPPANRYCTDVAKSIEAPIFHVNGDDVEAVVFVCNLAAEWRKTFKTDAVIDIICYRKYGHNELDNPDFTNPLMSQTIAKKESIFSLYKKKLLEEQTFTAAEIDTHVNDVWKKLEQSYENSKNYIPNSEEWMASTWKDLGFKTPKELNKEPTPVYDTGVDENVLKEIGKKTVTVPDGFTLHNTIKRSFKSRLEAIESGQGIDWSSAEALAFGSLLMEGTHVRLSGQDVERGTFSQRHSVLHDQKNDHKFTPLNHLANDQSKYIVCNSPLTEYGTLGFEYGYSVVNPNYLVLWEAQFGDFANGAQIIIDQFISSAEQKWLQRSGIVLSLPHGYDGQGPEHSSTRLERFLQLCDDHPHKYPDMDPSKRRQIQDSNMQVVYASTPANLFHVLRRQIHRDFRKPLILPFSKNLLRHPDAKSSLHEMVPKTMFQRYIPEVEPEAISSPDQIKRLIFCTGQVYYDIAQTRRTEGLKDVAIVRIEQLHPFPYDGVKEQANLYQNAEIIWCQEEPMNMGAWSFVYPRICTGLTKSSQPAKQVHYAGRDPSASPASGNKKVHEIEKKAFINEALTGTPKPQEATGRTKN